MTDHLVGTVARRCIDEHGDEIVVTLTPQGIEFRRPRSRLAVLLPYAYAETRAACLSAGIAPPKKARRDGTVARGLLATGAGA